MNQTIISALENIYISPLEACNLNCRSCYTSKTKNILTNNQILNFVNRYQNYLSKSFVKKTRPFLKSILFCGGEVFLLPHFPSLINRLIDQNIFITIITNGTIDRLSEIKNSANCQLLVSFDGPENVHNQNRGPGNFQKSKKFIQHALKLGFPVEIMFLINSTSYPYRNSFNLLNLKKTYLTDRLHSLTKDQVLDIKKNYPTYPSKNFGCFQLALQSNGNIYGCCESSKKLAHITDPPKIIVDNFIKSLSTCTSCRYFDQYLQDPICHGCTDPSFLCGYKSEISCKNCNDVVKSFCS